MQKVSNISLLAYLLGLWVVSMSYNEHLNNDSFDLCSFKSIAGDNLSWSDPQFDDSAWSHLFPISSNDSIWWMRFNMNIEEQLDEGKKYGLRLSVSAAHEVYFDGQLLGSNGKLKPAGKLAQVKYQKLYFIPDSLSQTGSHKIALRISNNETQKNFKIAIGDYIELAREPLILSVFIHILAGIFLTLGIVFFFQAQAQHLNIDLLLAGALAFNLLLLLIFEYLKFYYDYSYQFQLYRIRSIEYLSLSLAILFPLYLLFRYRVPHKLPIIAVETLILFGILYFVEGYDSHARFMILCSSLFSLGIFLFARDREDKTQLFLLGAILCCLLSNFLYYDITLFFGFAMFISSIALSYLDESLKEQRNYQLALLKSKRLEVELLKKKIQPHFLLNTLNSLIDVIEEDQQEAIAFIHALAELSDIVNEISSESSISISKELALCKAHLRLMSYRKEIAYSLNTHNLKMDEAIPPAIILTVLENGISHNKAIDGKMEFTISFSESREAKTYTIFSSGLPRKHQESLEDGIGNKYIKARLDEYCGKGSWSFHSQKDHLGWQTSIQLYKRLER